jgi:hypothetical protein
MEDELTAKEKEQLYQDIKIVIDEYNNSTSGKKTNKNTIQLK